MLPEIKHVTLVGPLAPPAGGMANQTKKLSEFLQQEQMAVNIIRVNQPYPFVWIGKLPGIRAGFRLIDYIVRLNRELKQTDIVHILANSGWSWYLFAAPAIMMAKRAGKPIILNYRGGYARDFFSQSWSKVNRSLNHVHKIIVPSLFLKEVFAEFEKQADIVPNVLDIDVFNTDSRNNNADPHVIVTRNLESIYDVETTIRAFNEIRMTYPLATMSVAGTGPELDNLKLLVEELQLKDKVKFVGRLNACQMAALYKSADLMLNASVVDNTPNSLIESLACGTPVVSTNVGGIPKLVTHQHDALLVEPKDYLAMAEQGLSILTQKSLQQTLKSNGLATVAQFHWKNVWQKLSVIYNQALYDNQKMKMPNNKKEEQC
jgi:L-malate glycosyltransferase